MKILLLPALGLLVVGSLFTGCSGGSDADTDAAGTDMVQPGDGMEAGSSMGSDETGHEDHGHGDDMSGDGAASDGAVMMEFGTMTYDSPELERTGTKEHLMGMRAMLKAELDGVREKMKAAGTDKEAQAEAQKRSAELAQGLERMDRLIKRIDGADDVAWDTVRESAMKEAGEVRAWMSQYGMNYSM